MMMVMSFFFLQLESIHDDEEVFGEPEKREKYPGHRPTTMLQKTLLTVGSAAVAILDPSRGGKTQDR